MERLKEGVTTGLVAAGVTILLSAAVITFDVSGLFIATALTVAMGYTLMRFGKARHPNLLKLWTALGFTVSLIGAVIDQFIEPVPYSIVHISLWLFVLLYLHGPPEDSARQ